MEKRAKQAVDGGASNKSATSAFSAIATAPYRSSMNACEILYSVGVSATGIGAPLGILGATYASFRIVTGGNSIRERCVLRE